MGGSFKAADIQEVTGIDVHGFKNAIKPDAIHHIARKHGKQGTSDHSMANIGEIGKVKYILDSYDTIRLGKGSKEYKNSDGKRAKSVVLQKK